MGYFRSKLTFCYVEEYSDLKTVYRNQSKRGLMIISETYFVQVGNRALVFLEVALSAETDGTRFTAKGPFKVMDVNV